MRFTTLATMTMLAGCVAVGPMAAAYAQPAPPIAGHPDDTRGAHRPGPMGGHDMGRPEGAMGATMGARMGGEMGPMHRHPIDHSLFALMYKPDDRKLTAPEVQKIAESMLLWFGNRTWKVTGVAPAADGQIAFAFATAEGSIIAHFTMDSKTGRVVRTG